MAHRAGQITSVAVVNENLRRRLRIFRLNGGKDLDGREGLLGCHRFVISRLPRAIVYDYS